MALHYDAVFVYRKGSLFHQKDGLISLNFLFETMIIEIDFYYRDIEPNFLTLKRRRPSNEV